LLAAVTLVLVLNPITPIVLFVLWAYPLAAWFWHRRAGADRCAGMGIYRPIAIEAASAAPGTVAPSARAGDWFSRGLAIRRVVNRAPLYAGAIGGRGV